MTSRKKRILAVAVPIEVALAALAWRDLAQRPATQIRGSKKFWRIFITVNPGNSVLYWLGGRRRAGV